jgi:hypothetical protein
MVVDSTVNAYLLGYAAVLLSDSCALIGAVFGNVPYKFYAMALRNTLPQSSDRQRLADVAAL